jgi:hypothetical protein
MLLLQKFVGLGLWNNLITVSNPTRDGCISVQADTLKRGDRLCMEFYRISDGFILDLIPNRAEKDGLVSDNFISEVLQRV